MDIGHIFDLIETRKEELFQLLSNLVKIDSQNFSSRGKEKEICQYIHQLCLDMGLDSAMYSPMELEGFADHPDYMPNHGLENRYNVTAVWRGETDENALMIMAHSDTVQFGDPANWIFSPTSGEIRDGRIYGRGSGDDKAGIAVSDEALAGCRL